MRIWKYLVCTILVMTCARWEKAMATEQIPYSVVRTLDSGVEIRDYGALVVAEIQVDAQSFREAGDSGFKRLAGYIFGANRSRRKIAMTAPVTMALEEGERIAMTAPVARKPLPDGGWRMSFYMPAGYSLETLPIPDDPAVTLGVEPPRRVAALRFSGSGTDKQFAERTAQMLAALALEGIATLGNPWTARYNAPWVLPPLRRNEAMIELAHP